MSIILHIVKREQWEKAKLRKAYRGDTLDSEGFIHCSTPRQVIKVANALFCAKKGLVLLCIETAGVQSEIRYEGTEGELYPHIYGPLNVDAVTKVLDFEPRKDGRFKLPKGIGNTSAPEKRLH
jgi:uncharacterized protein (DUF952 family)